MTNSEIRYHFASVSRNMKFVGISGMPFARTGHLIVALAETFFTEVHRPEAFSLFRERIHGPDADALGAISDLWNGGKITITGYSDEALIGEERAGLLYGARAWVTGQSFGAPKTARS